MRHFFRIFVIAFLPLAGFAQATITTSWLNGSTGWW